MDSKSFRKSGSSLSLCSAAIASLGLRPAWMPPESGRVVDDVELEGGGGGVAVAGRLDAACSA
eukprot:scaffold76622_cov26-Tisochrysis_lutea.AAC.1